MDFLLEHDFAFLPSETRRLIKEQGRQTPKLSISNNVKSGKRSFVGISVVVRRRGYLGSLVALSATNFIAFLASYLPTRGARYGQVPAIAP